MLERYGTECARHARRARWVRRIFKLGKAYVITLPKEFAADAEYALITLHDNKTLTVELLEVGGKG
jgi:hypothetical protein